MSSPRLSDVELLEKLLLGQASAAEIEQLSQLFANDSRLAERAETLANRGDTLLEALRGLRPIDDPEADRLVERLLQRLPSSLVTLTRAAEDTGDGSEAGSEPATMPENLEYFRVQKVLGEGGMGTVYLGYDTRLRREVAVKTLKPALAKKTEAKERFLREARTAAAVEHDHIIPIYYVGEADGIPFLVMALLKGTSLDDLLKQRRSAGETALPVAQAVRIARQIAVGLAAAHARGLVHRDIKPSNVWLETSPDQEFGEFRVKLLDFGLARSGEDDLHLTASGTILGTPTYMAPEQARGESVDHRCDLFSLGVVLYSMATGRLPFGGNTILAVLASLVMDTPVSPQLVNSELPPELSDLIMQLLTKDPAGRPASAKEVAARLGQIERRLGAAPNVLDESEERSFDLGQARIARAENAETADLTRHAPLVARRSSHAGAPRRNKRGALAAAAVALLVVGPLGWLYHGTIIHLVTNQGVLVIDVSDPNVDVRVEVNDVVIQDKTTQRQFTLTAGKGEIEVLEKDGIKLATRKFELTRGRTTTVTVTFQELAAARKPRQEPQPIADQKSPEPVPANMADLDRQAAEFFLSIGALSIKIRTQEAERIVYAVSALPKEPLQLTSVDLTFNQQVTDSGLGSFKGCQNLTSLSLAHSRVTDAGLVNFKNCKNLTALYLNDSAVTDAGLANFKDCRNLTELDIHGCPLVTDAGLVNFKSCKNLRALDLCATRATDAGLANFKDCRNLTELNLSGLEVTDAGLTNFKDCQNLTALDLGATRVTDAGLVNFKDCKNLTDLSLRGLQGTTPLTDAGLANFKDCALTVLQMYAAAVTDAGLAQFKNFKNLTDLELNGTQVTDAGLALFKDCKNLTALGLADTQVTDTGMANFKDCKKLAVLNLARTRVTDAGLAHFKGCTDLTSLFLSGVRVPGAGLASFKDCKKLWELQLTSTPISDANLADLALFDELGRLALDETRISLSGYEQLKSAMPRCQITWSETNRTVAEGVLAVLGVGGSLEIGRPGGDESRSVKAIADLPREYFQVRKVSLKGVEAPVDRLCEQLSKLRFADLDRVERVDFSGTRPSHLGYLTPIQGLKQLALVKSGIRPEWLAALPKLKRLALDENPIGAAGLENLANQSELTELTLASAGLTDSDLLRLPTLPKLARLVLDGNEIRGASFSSLKRQPALTELSLGCPVLTDLLAKNLAELKQLKRLSLAGSGISDASLAHVAALADLETLDVRKTKVTATGLAALAKALPACQIESDLARDSK